MKKSLIITWIMHCDYPLFRKFLTEHASYFDEILIYWSPHNRFPYYNSFMQSSLSYLANVRFLDPIVYDYGKDDWRNVATNELVKEASGDWIISIEQDWLCQDWEGFFTNCDRVMKECDLFGWLNPTRKPYIHPACFFIKHDLLEKTGTDFSPHPETPGSDHFSTITWKAQKLGAKILTLGVGDVETSSLAFHLGGINHNYLNFGTPHHAFHRGEIFKVYNYYSMQVEVPQHKRFMQLMKDVSVYLDGMYPEIDSKTFKWRKFFI